MAKNPITPKLIAHASAIYTQLAANSAEVGAGMITMKADPAALARQSFALASAFQKVEDELNAENLPKNQDFKVDVSNIADWNK